MTRKNTDRMPSGDRGGKREGAGRPPLPDDERLSAAVRIRLTENQMGDLMDLHVLHGYGARDVLLAGVAALKRKLAKQG